MPQDVTIRFEFLFLNCVFWGWLPLAKEDEILVEEGDLSLAVQFTPDGVLLLPGQDLGVPEETNYSFRTILAVVTVHGVPDEQIESIHTKMPIGDTSANYPTQLAQRVLKFVIIHINRIISYARNHKGQYWLSEIIFDPDNLHTALTKYKSQVKVSNSNWTRWNPTSNEIIINEGRLVDPTWCIQRSDWAGVKEFVTSSTKPPLVGHLLAEAEWHAEQGNLRVALTEGMAALEAAIITFAQTSTASRCFESLISGRIKAQSFPRLVDKLGVRGTLEVLFPIIFPENILSIDLLNDCISAVDVRGTVIHHGQRSLNKNNVQRYLSAIRKMCNFLKIRQEQSPEE